MPKVYVSAVKTLALEKVLKRIVEDPLVRAKAKRLLDNITTIYPRAVLLVLEDYLTRAQQSEVNKKEEEENESQDA